MNRKRTCVVAVCGVVVMAGGLHGQNVPIPQQEPFRTLRPTGADNGAIHGSCVAIGDDLIVVGAPGDEDSWGDNNGLVRVWLQHESTPGGSTPFLLELPVEQNSDQTDQPDSNQAPAFGAAIAITEGLIAVGAPWFDTEDMVDVGAVLVYRRLPNAFEHVATLTADRKVIDGGFGTSVQFDGEGGLCIGAPWSNAGIVERHVPLASGDWVHEATFSSDNGVAGDDFGSSLAWFEPRDLLVIAASGAGEVFLQQLTGDSGVPVPPLTTLPVSPGAGDFGSSVAADASRIAVGAPGGASGGAVILYASAGFSWQIDSVIGAPEGVDDFGIDTALDGRDLLVAGKGSSTEYEVHAFTVESDSPVVHRLDIRGDGSGAWRSLAVDSGVGYTGDPNAEQFGLAYLTLLDRDCDSDGVSDLDQMAANPELDCNDNQIFDACEILDGSATDCDGDGVIDDCSSNVTDCNANGIDDRMEGPEFCFKTPQIPVDLIVVADPSGSSDGKMPDLCSEVFRTAADRLSEDFDLRSAWVSMVLESPSGCDDCPECHDWTIPLETPVPVCDGVISRYIDNVTDGPGEEWGDGTAVMTRPYASDLLGQFPEWSERDAVLILVTISDEGPQDGGMNGDDACGCEDESSVWNLVRQAWMENVQILPMPTSGTPSCVYDPADPASLMKIVADETGGSVLDARNWPTDISSQVLSDRLETAVREAIESSPRIRKMAADFNDNGVVDVNDLLSLIALYGSVIGDENWSDRHDLDGDGFVGVNDLLLVLDAYGDNCKGKLSRIIQSGSDRLTSDSSSG